MNLKNILRGFLVYFLLIFVVSSIVSFLYSLIAHGHGIIDWESSFRFAIILGVALPLVGEFERRKK